MRCVSEAEKMKMVQIRSIICTGHTEMVTLDKLPESLIVISTGELSFCENGVSAADTNGRGMNEEYGKSFLRNF